MQWIEAFGYLGALMTLATFSMKTMLHLRMVGIVANLAFITYGVLDHVYPVLLLHMTLLPLNVWRLWQLLQMTRQIKADLCEPTLDGMAQAVLTPQGRSGRRDAFSQGRRGYRNSVRAKRAVSRG